MGTGESFPSERPPLAERTNSSRRSSADAKPWPSSSSAEKPDGKAPRLQSSDSSPSSDSIYPAIPVSSITEQLDTLPTTQTVTAQGTDFDVLTPQHSDPLRMHPPMTDFFSLPPLTPLSNVHHPHKLDPIIEQRSRSSLRHSHLRAKQKRSIISQLARRRSAAALRDIAASQRKAAFSLTDLSLFRAFARSRDSLSSLLSLPPTTGPAWPPDSPPYRCPTPTGIPRFNTPAAGAFRLPRPPSFPRRSGLRELFRQSRAPDEAATSEAQPASQAPNTPPRNTTSDADSRRRDSDPGACTPDTSPAMRGAQLLRGLGQRARSVDFRAVSHHVRQRFDLRDKLRHERAERAALAEWRYQTAHLPKNAVMRGPDGVIVSGRWRPTQSGQTGMPERGRPGREKKGINGTRSTSAPDAHPRAPRHASSHGEAGPGSEPATHGTEHPDSKHARHASRQTSGLPLADLPYPPPALLALRRLANGPSGPSRSPSPPVRPALAPTPVPHTARFSTSTRGKNVHPLYVEQERRRAQDERLQRAREAVARERARLRNMDAAAGGSRGLGGGPGAVHVASGSVPTAGQEKVGFLPSWCCLPLPSAWKWVRGGGGKSDADIEMQDLAGSRGTRGNV